MALLNKRVSPFFAVRCGSPCSLTSRASIRGTFNRSTFKFIARRWMSHSGQTPITRPTMAQLSSHAEQEPEAPPYIWYNTQGKRILWVDLHCSEFGIGETVLYPPDDEVAAGGKIMMMMKLKQFVKADTQKAPSERIDSVFWDTHYSAQPTAKMWRALDGLSPKHLDLVASSDFEDCRIKPLDTLKHQWNELESLTLRNLCLNPDFMKRSPNVFSRISSLTLDHCCGTSYFPPNVTNLKHLRILENNACDNLSYAVDNIPNLVQVLEVLEIESTNGCDFVNIYDPGEFRDRLQRCTSLREFRFSAGYPDSVDVDMASYIPPSVEKLTLRFTRSLPFLHDVDDWIKHASDRMWLPHLKSFQLTIDPESRVGGLKYDEKSKRWTRNLNNPPKECSLESFDVEFEGKRRVLYGVLKSTRPFSIDLLY